MPCPQQRWSDLSPARRRTIVTLGTAQVALQLAALVDLRRRAAEQVNGPKRLWVALSFVNWLGPLAYFALGRRR